MSNGCRQTGTILPSFQTEFDTDEIEQSDDSGEINGFGTADGQYMDAGIRLLELTRNMHRLFEKQQAAEKRRLLNFVCVELGLKGRKDRSSLAATV